ncbi:MAG: hypothetical protein RIF41_18995 [Polyangiaceae bacterium]
MVGWRASLFAVSCLVLGGCGTTTVWYGHTPDRSRRVEVMESGSFQSLRIGDVEHDRFRAVAVESLVFSDDGRHVAYAALQQGRWTVAFDGEVTRWFDAIGDVAMAADGSVVAYAALDERQWRVVLGDAPGPAFHAILADTLLLTADGRAAVYVGERHGRVHAVLHRLRQPADQGPAFEGIRRLTVGSQGRVAYVGRSQRTSRVVVDGEPQPAYEGIGELVLGAERYAYAARRADGWTAVVDGVEGPVFARVDDLRIGPNDRVAYVATTADGERQIFADGELVTRHPSIARDSLRVDPKGRLAWVVQQAEGMRMVLDGEPGPPFDAVAPAVFAPVGSRWGYMARQGDQTRVVIDGEPHGKYRWAADLVFSPDGRRYAYAAHARAQDYLVHDHGGRAVPKIIVGTVAFDPSSRHVGCVIGDPHTRQFHVTIDGVRHAPLDLRELVAWAAADPDRFREDTELLRRWVAAELALASKGGTR